MGPKVRLLGLKVREYMAKGANTENLRCDKIGRFMRLIGTKGAKIEVLPVQRRKIVIFITYWDLKCDKENDFLLPYWVIRCETIEN